MSTPQTLVLDIECYKNYFLVKFKHVENGNVREYEMFDGQPLNVGEIKSILTSYRIVTFNGLNYDMPMLTYALVLCMQVKRGEITPIEACQLLKNASDSIIVGNMRGWQFEQQYAIKVPASVDHIDISEVAPGVMISLKQYGGRMHSRKLQDLPIDPSAEITPEQRPLMRDYCGNDLDTTIDLWKKLTTGKDDVIAIRENIGAEKGIDLRSKSDAQVAEAVIRSEVEKLKRERIYRPEISAGTRYKYRPPAFIKFQTKQLQDVLAAIVASDFTVKADGKIAEPAALADAKIVIGTSTYTMGIGGLHSCEKSVSHFSTEDVTLYDRDVTSFYPELIMQCGLAPTNMGHYFLQVYGAFLRQRKELKKTGGNPTLVQMLKIFLNGTFGKLGSRYSVLYAPDLLIQVTVTGQLVLLMMIEALELFGIPVVSANTDGIVIKCPIALRKRMLEVVATWEKATNLETEEVSYRSLHSRDINNYVALKDGGGYKAKGAFTSPGLMKNPQHEICNMAAATFLEHGTPIAETIFRCKDVTKFITVRNVADGGIKITNTRYDDTLTPSKKRDVLLAHGWEQIGTGPLTKARFNHWSHLEGPLDVESAYRIHCGEDAYRYLGKVVRWYHSVGEHGAIHYLKKNATGNHNKVASSDGAMPLMDLPEAIPGDIDYEWYLRETNDILRDVGAVR